MRHASGATVQAEVSASVPKVIRLRDPICRVVIGTGRRGGSGPIIPRRGRRRDDARWIPPSGSVTVNGFDIPGGMVYVGSFLAGAPGGGQGTDIPAPCLINPSLKIASSRVSTDVDTGSWPSYTDITPEHRRTYLNWLSTGKRDTRFPIGYAFLYFYGLERRLLVDNPRPGDEVLLVEEVKRLRNLYAWNHSFDHYCKALLDIIELRRMSAGPSGLDTWAPDPNAISPDMPLPLRMKLAIYSATGTSLNFEHAMAGMLSLDLEGMQYTTAMARTRPEFIELVRRRFAKKFPDGFRLQDRKDSTLALDYRAASEHLDVAVRVEGIDRLPDPTTLNWTRMSELCTKAAEDLEPYAKVVAKNRTRTTSLRASLLLPPELADFGAIASFKQWFNGLPGPVAEVTLKTLGQRCFGGWRKTRTVKQAREMSAMLARVGYGMEPDPTYGTEKPKTSVLLFRVVDTAAATDPGTAFYYAALVTVVLASAEPRSDGVRVVSELAARLHLDATEAIRLEARYRLMRGRSLPPGLIKALANRLSNEDQDVVAAMTVAVAAACGEMSLAMVATLQRLHRAVGIERRRLNAGLHQRAAATALRATEPDVVASRVMKRRAFRIPPLPAAPPTQDGAHGISMPKVSAMLRETGVVAKSLASVYEKNEPPASRQVSKIKRAVTNGRFRGLGLEHAGLLEALRRRESWGRAEFEAKAHAFGLMPHDAIKTINDWACDAVGEELVEDGDPLSINVALVRTRRRKRQNESGRRGVRWPVRCRVDQAQRT